jgi:hypothetical protein
MYLPATNNEEEEGDTTQSTIDSQVEVEALVRMCFIVGCPFLRPPSFVTVSNCSGTMI